MKVKFYKMFFHGGRIKELLSYIGGEEEVTTIDPSRKSCLERDCEEQRNVTTENVNT